MSIERAIHEAWGAWKPLTDLVPEDRFVTGIARFDPDDDTVFPYVTFNRQGDAAQERTSGGNIAHAALMRFDVYALTQASAKSVADGIVNRFNRLSADYSLGTLLDCKPTNQNELEEADGVWHVMLDFMIRAGQTSF